MATVDELSEKQIIDKFFNRSGPLPAGIHGIGDDCAAYKANKDSNEWQLVTADALVENTHFLMDRVDPADLGYKAMAVNISDIAAMAGRPVGAFVSIALPNKLKTDWLQNFSEGVFEVCERWQIPVLGGDTVVSDDKLYVSITLTGKVGEDNIRFRSGAESGDIICVTGPLGDASAGLQLELGRAGEAGESLERKTRTRLIQRHYRPPINLDIGSWLGKQNEVKALIDLSDGLASDLHEIIKVNSLGVNIVREQYPLSDELRDFARNTNFSLYQLAEDGGEDYHLMFAVDPGEIEKLEKNYQERFDRDLYRIGDFTDQHGDVQIFQNDQPIRRNPAAFRYFTVDD